MTSTDNNRILADLEYLEQHLSQTTTDELYENASHMYNLAVRNIGKLAGIPDEQFKSRYMALVNKLIKYLPSQPQEKPHKKSINTPEDPIIKPVIRKVFDPNDLSDWYMTKNEQNLFIEYISDANIYLEFGTGGSTVVTLSQSKAHIYSVESSKDWIECIRQKYDIIEKSEKEGRLDMLYADIGNVGEWGVPVKQDFEQNKEKYLNYSKHIFYQYPEIKQADVVLIDGRFRVACCLQILLNAKDDTTILFHDYWVRPEYHVVKRFVDYIDGVDKFMVCKKKDGLSENLINDVFEKYKYECQ